MAIYVLAYRFNVSMQHCFAWAVNTVCRAPGGTKLFISPPSHTLKMLYVCCLLIRLLKGKRCGASARPRLAGEGFVGRESCAWCCKERRGLLIFQFMHQMF